MPLPLFLLGGLAAAVGIGGHLDAKETNEKAQKVSNDAQVLYNNAKFSLQSAKSQSENSLAELGTTKKNIMETSVKQFIRSYDRIKNFQFNPPLELNELSNLMVNSNSVLQLQKMTNIYESAFSSGATGAATGALIALAASGSLPIVTGTLSIAGSALAAGEIGAAASIAGSALSFGAAMTPLAAVAAPVVLFTGISSSLKADENLEKAYAIYSEAEAAAEKMKISETLCNSISKKSEMFNSLLKDLDVMFSASVNLLDDVTLNIEKERKRGKRDNSFTREEAELIAVSRALCGAVKTILDTPILDSNGNITEESQNAYETIQQSIPNFSQTVTKIRSYDYKNYKGKGIKRVSHNNSYSSSNNYDVTSSLPRTIGNVFSIIVGVVAASVFYNFYSNRLLSFMILSTISIFIIDNNTDSKLFRMIKNILCISLCVESALLLYNISDRIAGSIGVAILSLILGIVAFIILSITSYISQDQHALSSIGVVIMRFSALLLIIFAAMLVISVIGFISTRLATIIALVLFVPLSLIAIFLHELNLESNSQNKNF